MKKILLIISILLVLVAAYLVIKFKSLSLYNDIAIPEEEKPNTLNKNQKPQNLIIGLPLKIKNDEYIIYPIGKMLKTKNTSGKLSIGKTVNNYQHFNVHPNLSNTRNLLFKSKTSEKFHFLTLDKILIFSFNQVYYYTDSKRKLSDYIIYKVIDTDFNNNNILDSNDIFSLYIGTTDGLLFKKLNKKNENLIDWKVLEKDQKIILRTISDSNNDNLLDENDKISIYEVLINRDPIVKQILDFDLTNERTLINNF